MVFVRILEVLYLSIIGSAPSSTVTVRVTQMMVGFAVRSQGIPRVSSYGASGCMAANSFSWYVAPLYYCAVPRFVIVKIWRCSTWQRFRRS